MLPNARIYSRSSLLFALLLVPFWLIAQQPKKSATVRRLERERTNLLKAIKETDRQIKSLGKDLSAKKKRETLVAKQVADRTQVIAILDHEVSLLTHSIDSLDREITSLRAQEQKSLEAYKETLLTLQRTPRYEDQLLFILSSKSFDQAVRRIRYISSYARSHRLVAEELRVTRQQLDIVLRNFHAHKREKGALLQIRAQEKANLQKEQTILSQEVKKISSEQSSLQKKQKKQKQRAQQLDQMIQDQIAREIAEAEQKAREERERLKREGQKKGGKVDKKVERLPETKDGYAMDASERALAKSFAANKGKLPPPVTARYRVIRRFGLQQHDDLSRVQTRNGGIDIQVPVGTPVVAVFEGVVSKVFVLPGYHNSVIIRHGNYLTVYANLETVSVSKGQKVSTGQKIGTVAADIESGDGLIQFQVWHERTKQNPQAWIR